MNRKLSIAIVSCILALATWIIPVNAEQAPEAILIGATVSQTGHFSSEVGPFKRLMESWANLVNGQGGIMIKKYGKRLPVKFVIYDDKSDEATANKYYERLATVDKVNLLLGPYSSPLTFAASAAAENHKIPFLAICANSPKIYSRGYKWLVGVIDLGSRYTYRYWEMIKSEGKTKTVAFVVEDTLHPLGVFKGSKKLAEEAGLKVVAGDIVPPKAHDFTPVITKLKKETPDIIYVASNIPFAVNFMKQAREMKLNPREYHCIHHSGVFREALGAAADNVVGQSYWVEGMKTGSDQLIGKVLEPAKISEPMYPWAPAYVAAFQIVQAAVEKAGTLDNNDVMAALKGLTLETVLGKEKFHETGYGSINTYPSQIQGDKYVVIWPSEVATGKHVYPRSPWK
jgi:branched-chain amino acid transport system substrate-binding protein